ncbi:MAG: hypothetical protein JO251_21800 [Verrucomicrobia bacterium]|nr:hypothetical protein [Verrucomicrobiota bacterium]
MAPNRCHVRWFSDVVKMDWRKHFQVVLPSAHLVSSPQYYGVTPAMRSVGSKMASATARATLFLYATYQPFLKKHGLR